MRQETFLRSSIKSIVWRLLGFIILGLITYLYIGEWGESLIISGWFNGIRFVLYIVHERIWNKIKWGIK